MGNLLQYIRDFGQQPFSERPFDGVDGLVLAELTMCKWENGMIEQAEVRNVPLLQDGVLVSDGFSEPDDRRMVELIQCSERFGTLRVSDYAYRLDPDAETQFAAITYHLPDGSHFVCFRGTDRNLIGWKEDCNMSFRAVIPSQEYACEYLARIAARYEGTLRVGGHSKGGNMSIFASATADPAVRDRITAIYSYDGPGLNSRADADRLYPLIEDRLHFYVPQGSLVGMLLAHPDHYAVVQSDALGFGQHDPFTWVIIDGAFSRREKRSWESLWFERTFQNWIRGVTDEHRGEFVDAVFSILGATNAEKFDDDLWRSYRENPSALKRASGDVPPDVRDHIKQMIRDFAKTAVRKDPEDKKTE